MLLSVQVGARTLAMAQAVLHHIAQVLAPGCMPLFLSDGYAHYLTAIVAHFGHWVQPPRRQARGPAPQPRWMPLSQMLYAQVVKTMRRRRLVTVKHRVAFGTQAAVIRCWRPAAGRSIRHLSKAQSEPAPAGGGDEAAQRHGM